VNLHFPRRIRLRLTAIATAVAALLAAGVMTAANAAQAGQGCQVDYEVTSQWPSGFNAAVTVTNLGDPIEGWDLEWVFLEGQHLTHGWNAAFTTTAETVNAESLSYNKRINTGSSVSFGFNGYWAGVNTNPTEFRLNGRVCDGSVGEPTTAPTSDPPTEPTEEPTGGPSGPPSALSVEGNQLVNVEGDEVVLNGFNRTGAEWPCRHGWGFVDGPVDDAAVEAIVSWNPNTVRVPMNQQCWLGYGETTPEWTGENYRAFIEEWVTKLTDAGVYVVLDLHWSSPGTTPAEGQQKMADADHSPDFWTSVAERFKDNPAVLYDLYNEPHDITDECWRDGCIVDGWEAAGMQDLLDAVRATGATQPVIVTCNWWGNGCGGWLDFQPIDPLGNVVASVHVYETTGCNTQACWESDVAPIAAEVPTVYGEFGENDCNHNFSDDLAGWADDQGIGWLAWSWYPSCDMPGLITDWDGTPSGYGLGIQELLANRP